VRNEFADLARRAPPRHQLSNATSSVKMALRVAGAAAALAGFGSGQLCIVEVRVATVVVRVSAVIVRVAAVELRVSA
jgi:hypothetical protein